MKRLSVIIPGYKTPEEWWTRCVSSVLKACGDNDEVLLVNDGCAEQIDFLNELGQTDSRIKIFHTENQGQAVARNLGMKEAEGEFIAFVDSDDEVLPEVYDCAIPYMEENGSDISVWGVQTIWLNAGLMKTDMPTRNSYGVLSPKDFKLIYSACLFNYPWNKIYRKSFLTQNQIVFQSKGIPSEDEIFNLDCLISGAKWCAIDYLGSIYYRIDNTSLGRYKKYNRDRVALVADAWERYCATSSEAETLFSMHYQHKDAQIFRSEWDNLWRINSPYTLKMKYDFLKENQTYLKSHPTWIFFKTLIFKFLRAHFYLRPIRRWHIKRMYPHAEDWIK